MCSLNDKYPKLQLEEQQEHFNYKKNMYISSPLKKILMNLWITHPEKISEDYQLKYIKFILRKN